MWSDRYIRKVDAEIVQEAVQPFAAAFEQGTQQTSDAGAAFGARFWSWWISLCRPDSRPTTASL